MTASKKTQTKKPDKSASANRSDSCSSNMIFSSSSASDDTFPDTQSVCSATDCTGLIPALPSSEAELEAYEEMYQFCLKEKSQDC